jgi:hypothetical protein
MCVYTEGFAIWSEGTTFTESGTLHEVENLLREAVVSDEDPLSLAEIGRRMHAKSVRRSTIRVCVDELKRLHFVTEDPRRGVMWTLHTDPGFWSRKGVRKL